MAGAQGCRCWLAGRPAFVSRASLAPPAAGMTSDAFADFVVGHGELWSAQLMAAALEQMGADVVFMDTRDVLVVRMPRGGGSEGMRGGAEWRWIGGLRDGVCVCVCVYRVEGHGAGRGVSACHPACGIAGWLLPRPAG